MPNGWRKMIGQRSMMTDRRAPPQLRNYHMTEKNENGVIVYASGADKKGNWYQRTYNEIGSLIYDTGYNSVLYKYADTDACLR